MHIINSQHDYVFSLCAKFYSGAKVMKYVCARGEPRDEVSLMERAWKFGLMCYKCIHLYIH